MTDTSFVREDEDHSKCGASTGICERTTFGQGKLDNNGYWDRPCHFCARKGELRSPYYGEAWPGCRQRMEMLEQLEKLYPLAFDTSQTRMWISPPDGIRNTFGLKIYSKNRPNLVMLFRKLGRELIMLQEPARKFGSFCQKHEDSVDFQHFEFINIHSDLLKLQEYAQQQGSRILNRVQDSSIKEKQIEIHEEEMSILQAMQNKYFEMRGIAIRIAYELQLHLFENEPADIGDIVRGTVIGTTVTGRHTFTKSNLEEVDKII